MSDHGSPSVPTTQGEREVPLGGERPSGEAGCGFGIDPHLCGEKATMHVLWIADTENVIACTKHFNEYLAPRMKPGEADMHTFDGVCTMPGTRWKFSEAGQEGFCFFEFPDGVDAAEEVALTEATP